VRSEEITVAPLGEAANDYRDLQEATDLLHKSLSLPAGALPPWAKGDEIPMDEASLRTKIATMRDDLTHKLGEGLFCLLYENVRGEDEPNCAQFVDIMNESDSEVVEQMRQLIALENMS